MKHKDPWEVKIFNIDMTIDLVRIDLYIWPVLNPDMAKASKPVTVSWKSMFFESKHL